MVGAECEGRGKIKRSRKFLVFYFFFFMYVKDEER